MSSKTTDKKLSRFLNFLFFLYNLLTDVKQKIEYNELNLNSGPSPGSGGTKRPAHPCFSAWPETPLPGTCSCYPLKNELDFDYGKN
ncbi:MAG: hypothetical protein ACUVRL_00480 [Candidatus Saccharicenans sp.]|uniref:hypothetical protein n=1 Tax=Candidatus Saccharicenans sp. TaxID=2819258 RepID=UPI00404A8EFF